MRCLARTSLALAGLLLLSPASGRAQYPPAYYPSTGGYAASKAADGSGGSPYAAPSPSSSPTTSIVGPNPDPASNPRPVGMPDPTVGLGNKQVAASAKPAAKAPAPAEQPHHHRSRILCASCRAKEAQANGAPVHLNRDQARDLLSGADGLPVGGKIVGCAHSKNGVCPACQALLSMPGQVVMGAPTPPAAPAGRAVVSSGPSTSGVQVAFGDPMPEPAPVGVVQANYAQANYAQAAPMGSPLGAPAGMPAGRAVAESGPKMGGGSAPFLGANGSDRSRPHILGHLFGWSYLNPNRDEKSRQQKQAHASIPYNNEGSTVDELPASMVFGKNH